MSTKFDMLHVLSWFQALKNWRHLILIFRVAISLISLILAYFYLIFYLTVSWFYLTFSRNPSWGRGGGVAHTHTPPPQHTHPLATSLFVLLLAYAWTMILCLCLWRSFCRRLDCIPLFCLLVFPYTYAYAIAMNQAIVWVVQIEI